MSGESRGSPLPRVVLAALMASSCGTPLMRLPAGPGRPAPDVATAITEATSGCRAVSSITAIRITPAKLPMAIAPIVMPTSPNVDATATVPGVSPQTCPESKTGTTTPSTTRSKPSSSTAAQEQL